MCGISGYLTTRSESNSQLRDSALKMSNAISHRGPDGSGAWTDENHGIALSHRRLSIVDLSDTGAQPMVSHCGNWVVVYNGEIYNAAELRQDLVALGSRFRGSSDTEVILEGFAQWGISNTIVKCIGMFAIAVWNRKECALTLVRDRLGIKPLYWSKTTKDFLFGSELRALRTHNSCPTQLNSSSIAGYVRKGYINNPHTIYEGVNQLQPGSILTLKANSDTPSIETYWSLSDVAEHGIRNQYSGDFEDAKSHLEKLLTDAISRRMISDVPLGAFLSGGIDSSAVVALMQKCASSPIRTFSIGFDEAEYDESSHAAAVAQHLGTEHTELTVTAQDALDLVPSLPTLFDEPFADPSQIPTYLLSKLTSQHVTVALSGDGGDELFAGYSRYAVTQKYRRFLNKPWPLRKLGAFAMRNLHPGTMTSLYRSSKSTNLQQAKNRNHSVATRAR